MRDLLFARRLLCPGTDAAVVGTDAATKGATDVAASAAADAAAADTALAAGGTAAGLADAGALAAVGDTALAGAGATTAFDAGALAGGAGALGGAGAETATLGEAAGASTIGANAAADALPSVTVAAPAAGAGGGNLAPLAAGAAGGAVGATMGGGSGTAGTQATAQDVTTPSDASSFLPATGSSDVTGLSSDVANSLGIDTTAPASPVGGGGVMDFGTGEENLATTDAIASDPGGSSSFGSDLMSWFSNPKNLATAGMLGISGMNALSRPKLPGAAQTALGAAGPAVQQAQAVIQSGGTATPVWAQQKASIDASINQQEQQLTESIMQSAANAGEGGQNSGIVQQQIQQMKGNLEVQRQQLYAQAQSQNVQEAVSMLTGGNQTLSAIAQMQLAQQEQARQAATQTAQLALQLQQLSFPGG